MTEARLVGIALVLAAGVSACGGGGGAPSPSGPATSSLSIPLRSCLDAAGKDYEAKWADACKSQAEARWVALKNCLEDPNTGGNQLMGEVYCHSLFSAADPRPACSLPSSIAENIDKSHDDAKQQCLREAKLS